MRGLDPAVLQAVPLSKQDTRGNSFLRLCSLLSWCTTVAGMCAPLKRVVGGPLSALVAALPSTALAAYGVCDTW